MSYVRSARRVARLLMRFLMAHAASLVYGKTHLARPRTLKSGSAPRTTPPCGKNGSDRSCEKALYGAKRSAVHTLFNSRTLPFTCLYECTRRSAVDHMKWSRRCPEDPQVLVCMKLDIKLICGIAPARSSMIFTAIQD